MRILKTSKEGDLTKSEVAFFGGNYNFVEKLKMNGTGSCKIIYESGINLFDKIKLDSLETSFINFEILKNGLIIRFNKTQKLAFVGIKLTEIKKLILFAYRIEIRYINPNDKIVKIKKVKRGEFAIVSINNEIVKFTALANNFKVLKSFFEKPHFQNFYEFLISSNPPEVEFRFTRF